MSKIVVFNSITLDGVMQAPGRPDEDTRGGFQYGGWAGPYADPDMGRAAGENMATSGALLLGRRTYEDLYSSWHGRTDNNPFTAVLDNAPKYVASRTLREPLPWMNSILLQGDVPAAVAKLKEQPGKDMVMLGSGELIQTLMQHNLIDTYMLLIHPLVLGSGRHLFSDSGPFTKLHLVDSKTTGKGVVIATYQPEETTSP